MPIFENKRVKTRWRPRIQLPTVESHRIEEIGPHQLPTQVGTHAVPNPPGHAYGLRARQAEQLPQGVPHGRVDARAVQQLPGTDNVALIPMPTVSGVGESRSRGNPTNRVMQQHVLPPHN